MVAPTTFWINGRFLTRKVTGVERVAHEVLRALATHYLDARGRVRLNGHDLQFKWVLEAHAQATIPSYASQWERQAVGKRTGHAWEQLDLIGFANRDWLLNLCNTGPLLRKRQVIFFHDAQAYAIPGNFDWKFRWWYKTLLWAAGRRSRVVITNSQFSKSELVRYARLSSDKITVMHLGTDHMDRMTPAMDGQLQTRLGDQPFVLAVSSASPNKNFAGVVQALEQIAPAPTCVIVGQQYSKVFKSDALAKGQVIQAGYVSDETLAALYQRASCLVYPSFYEGFGLPPLEAMRMGCPVVVSNTSSLPEVCGSPARYCDPHDPASIAQAIESVLALQNNPVMQHRLREESQAHARSYTWQRSAHTLLQTLVAHLETNRS